MDGAAHVLDPLVEAAVHVFSPELFQKIGAVILGHIVDDGLEVVGQAVVAFLIHDHVKGGSGDVQQRDVLDFLTVAPGNQRYRSDMFMPTTEAPRACMVSKRRPPPSKPSFLPLMSSSFRMGADLVMTQSPTG